MYLNRLYLLKITIFLLIILIASYVFLLYPNDYVASISKESQLFPPYIVTGILKYDTNYLKKGERVKVLWSTNNQFYIVKDSSNRRIKLSWWSIYIEENTQDTLPDATDDEIESFANSKEIFSSTDYLLWTDLARLKTYALIKDNNKWKLIKRMSCSTGDNLHPTPCGIFEIQYTTPFIGTEYNYVCKNAVVFYRGFMFHSVPYDWNGEKVIDNRIGSRISNGCIRLSVEDSKWIYNNIPIGTSVFIR